MAKTLYPAAAVTGVVFPSLHEMMSIHSTYRARNKGMQILLSNSQAGPGRRVKQEQEEISRNHVQAFIPGSVFSEVHKSHKCKSCQTCNIICSIVHHLPVFVPSSATEPALTWPGSKIKWYKDQSRFCTARTEQKPPRALTVPRPFGY